MDVLYITFDPVEANSSAMMRNIGIIQGLIENGHNVEVLTISPSINHQINEKNFFSELKVYRVGSSSVYNAIERNKGKIKKFISKLLRRVYKKICVYNNTYFSAKRINKNVLSKNKYDIVISSSDPKTSHVVARKLRKDGLIAERWIQYWGDPLSLDITNTTIWPRWILKLIEKNLLKYADSIVYVSPFTYKKQILNFKKYENKMTIVPIPYITSKKYELVKDFGKEKLKLAYLGSYYSNIRNILPLYQAVQSLPETTSLIIAGLTNLELLSNKNIKVLPNLPKKEIEIYEDDCDVIVCILNKKGTQIPGKLYHYAGTNKPILVIIDGEYGDEIRSYLQTFDRYHFCNNTKEDITKALMEIRNNYTCNSATLLSPKRIAKLVIEQNKEIHF